MSSAIAKALPAAEGARKWRPSMGHVYHAPASQPAAQAKDRDYKSGTPMPEAAAKAAPVSQKNEELSLERVAEEALRIHMRYGGEYIDENPIAGRPGEFHLSSTGRKAVPPPQVAQRAGLGAMNGPTLDTKVGDKKDGKSDRTPKSATTPKTKRRKSKVGTGTPAAS